MSGRPPLRADASRPGFVAWACPSVGCRTSASGRTPVWNQARREPSAATPRAARVGRPAGCAGRAAAARFDSSKNQLVRKRRDRAVDVAAHTCLTANDLSAEPAPPCRERLCVVARHCEIRCVCNYMEGAKYPLLRTPDEPDSDETIPCRMRVSHSQHFPPFDSCDVNGVACREILLHDRGRASMTCRALHGQRLRVEAAQSASKEACGSMRNGCSI